MSGPLSFAPRRGAVVALLVVALLASLSVSTAPASAAAPSVAAPASAAPASAAPASVVPGSTPVGQSPFLCLTEDNGLGQPIVDNQDGRGTPVYPLGSNGQPDRRQDPLGWSEGCQAEERTTYRYRTTSGQLRDLPPAPTELPADVMMLPVDGLVGSDDMELGGATEIPYVLRYERGTLPENRFLWSIAMLVPWEEVIGEVDASHDHWNGRLVYSFDGGVGIGHTQGHLSDAAGTQHDAMQLGHAVLYSSGTATLVHYNLMLGGRTAVEAKARFEARHGAPRYTVGIGGSGGGVQQYTYGQNHVGVIDAAIPQFSFPDMATQLIHMGDCEPLEHYMDVTDAENPRWSDWDERRLLIGLNSIEGYPSIWRDVTGQTGASECSEGWRGAAPLTMNPTFGFAPGMESALLPFLPEMLGKINRGQAPVPDDFPDIGRLLRVSEDPEQWVEWSHFADTLEVYGTDPDTGEVLVPWDNVGVQYGLRSMLAGDLTVDEFVDLNGRVGSWGETADAVLESCGLIGVVAGAGIDLGGFDLGVLAGQLGLCRPDAAGEPIDRHSARQMRLGDGVNPAPRRPADLDAIRRAFEHGLVFQGQMPRTIPIIDTRPYLEHRLDPHNTHQSWVSRERIVRAQGHADHHLIWFLDARPGLLGASNAQLMRESYTVTDAWMLNIEDHPTGDVVASKPATAVDRCWDTDGTLIAEGDDVWDGAAALITSGRGAWTERAPEEVDGQPTGDCTRHFPLHSTSRIVAGGPLTGDVYKCHTMPLATALEEGVYGDHALSAAHLARLDATFPEGVCDYGLPGVGDPRAEVLAAVTADPGDGVVVVRDAVPGAVIELRRGGEVVATQVATEAGAATVPAEPGVHVVAQRVGGTRGVLSAPVVVAEAVDPPPTDPPPSVPGLPFRDIDAGFVHTPAIVRLAERGILLGRPDGTFRPFEDLTRAQMASVVARALALEPVGGAPFADVDPSGAHAGAIGALAARGIVQGRAGGTFEPGAGVTRGQLASMLARAAGLEGARGARFTDTAGSVHEPAIAALAATGVVGGYPDGTFRPGRVVTRAQAATFVSGLLDVTEPTPRLGQG